MENAIIILSLLNALLIICLILLVSWNKKIEKDLLNLGNATVSSLERFDDRVTLIIQSLTPKQKEIFDLKVEELKLREEKKEVYELWKQEYEIGNKTVARVLMDKGRDLENKGRDLKDKINKLYKELK